MTIYSTEFQSEIDAVDNTKDLTFETDEPGYGFGEFSYSDPLNNGNYTIVGGSDFACNYGGFALLRALGYRFYGEVDAFRVRPASITAGLSRAQGEMAIAFPSWGITDGFNYVGTYIAEGTTFRNRYSKWTKLLGCNYTVEPWYNGHIYTSITDNHPTTKRARNAYFVANPNLITVNSANEDCPDLVGALVEKRLGISTDRWDKLVNYFARWMAPNIGPANNYRNRFDPIDGDMYGVDWSTLTLAGYEASKVDGVAQFPYGMAHSSTPNVNPPGALLNSSDTVVEFTEAVAAKIREGAPAIPGYFASAYAAMPLTKLGILAYADHSRPPSSDVLQPDGRMTDAIYVQVAAGYLYWGETFAATVDAWRAVTHLDNPITTYMYPDLIHWQTDIPLYNRFVKTNSIFKIFNDTNNLKGFRMEYSPNCLNNCVMVNWTQMRTLQAGVTYDDALDEIMTTLFDDDPAVREYFEYTSTPYNGTNVYTLGKVFTIVESMAEGWYKELFKQYITTASRWWRWRGNHAPVNDAFRAAMIEYLSNVHAARSSGIYHAYSIIYRRGASYPLTQGYPEISWQPATLINEAVPAPNWYLNPVAADDTDFASEKAFFDAATGTRSATLDNLASDNLLVLSGLTCSAPKPGGGSWTPKGTPQVFPGSVRLLFVGPGTLQITSTSVDVASTTTAYAAGVHEIDIFQSTSGTTVSVTALSGLLFFDAFSGPQRGAPNVGYSFFWCPEVANGVVDIQSNNGYYYHTGGQMFVSSSGSTATTIPGMCAIDDAATQAGLMLGNVNPMVGTRPDITLAPIELVELEYPGLIKATIV